MTAKKKRKSKKKVHEATFVKELTAVKLTMHEAGEDQDGNKTPGLYRYVIAGMLITTKPLENFPKDYQGSLVYEAIEQGSIGLLPAGMFRDALSVCNTRESKCQGCSADQALVRLRDI